MGPQTGGNDSRMTDPNGNVNVEAGTGAGAPKQEGGCDGGECGEGGISVIGILVVIEILASRSYLLQ